MSWRRLEERTAKLPITTIVENLPMPPERVPLFERFTSTTCRTLTFSITCLCPTSSSGGTKVLRRLQILGTALRSAVTYTNCKSAAASIGSARPVPQRRHETEAIILCHWGCYRSEVLMVPCLHLEVGHEVCHLYFHALLIL